MTSELTLQMAKEFLEEAKVDLESARSQVREKRFHKAVFEAQQCVEKLMKAALSCEGLTQIYEHDISGFFASEVISGLSRRKLKVCVRSSGAASGSSNITP